jgi:hypothetical protein
VEINQQLKAREGNSQKGGKCGVPDEPQKKDYFPKEPHGSLLSEVLAAVIGVMNLDGVEGDSNARRVQKIRGAASARFRQSYYYLVYHDEPLLNILATSSHSGLFSKSKILRNYRFAVHVWPRFPKHI